MLFSMVSLKVAVWWPQETQEQPMKGQKGLGVAQDGPREAQQRSRMSQEPSRTV